MFPALGEEVGWRGYMMPRLKERFGLLNGRLLGGVVWGVWHWPLMLLVGYEYGTNYLGAPLLGLVVWCVVCFALNTLLDILYEKTESIWVPAIAHGAFNAIAALPQVLVTPADAYYNVLGPMPIGLIAALPMLAAAVWLTLREMKQEEKKPFIQCYILGAIGGILMAAGDWLLGCRPIQPSDTGMFNRA